MTARREWNGKLPWSLSDFQELVVDNTPSTPRPGGYRTKRCSVCGCSVEPSMYLCVCAIRATAQKPKSFVGRKPRGPSYGDIARAMVRRNPLITMEELSNHIESKIGRKPDESAVRAYIRRFGHADR